MLGFINNEFADKEITFDLLKRDFNNSEKKKIENNPDDFLNLKYIENSTDKSLYKYYNGSRKLDLLRFVRLYLTFYLLRSSFLEPL